MRTYTLTECCALFQVNAKTFRKWLEREGMQPQRSRADTRIRYLTREQVEHLAEVYGCALPPDEEPVPKDENTSDPATLLAERLDRQKRRLEHLEREMRQTQASMAVLQQQVPAHPCASVSTDKSQQIRQPGQSEQREGSNEHRPMPKARTKIRPKKGGKGLPRTLELLRVFAEAQYICRAICLFHSENPGAPARLCRAAPCPAQSRGPRQQSGQDRRGARALARQQPVRHQGAGSARTTGLL